MGGEGEEAILQVCKASLVSASSSSTNQLTHKCRRA